METAVVSALAALSGSALGALAPITSNYMIQRSQTQRELLTRSLVVRQNLYSEFIQAGAKLYAEASTSTLDKLDDLTTFYALIGRMRLIASTPVIDAAEAFVKCIVTRFGESNLTIEDFRVSAVESHADPLKDFSTKCRIEIQNVFQHPS
jgi:hypothetical protein